MTRYVALLRAVNIGGGSSMVMADLREVFAGCGFDGVQTYIQSGNVVFGCSSAEEEVVADIRRGIADRWGRDVPVLVRSLPELEAVIAANPYLDQQDDLTKLLVTFLDRAPTPETQDSLTSPAGETGTLTLVGREVFVHVPDGYGRSKLGNAFVEKRTGALGTTRNWRSVLKLRDMAAA
ncbi:DUF1697 domain-containing protein [Micromonospora sp. NPDC000207]|uniref:DUF1697 domain-containing protein n=1 Tax=Micromonospora sp. NPDC000207 TaxID=3154246 RepID=UPI00331DC1E4